MIRESVKVGQLRRKIQKNIGTKRRRLCKRKSKDNRDNGQTETSMIETDILIE